jgi:hypothetical protein
LGTSESCKEGAIKDNSEKASVSFMWEDVNLTHGSTTVVTAPKLKELIHMKISIPSTLFKTSVFVATFLLIAVVCPHWTRAADTLDDLLGTQESKYKEASPETKQLWETTLSAVEKNEYDSAPALLQQFLDVKDVVEPYQKTFCELTLKLLTPSSDASSPQTNTVVASSSHDSEIKEIKSEIASLEGDVSTQEKKRPALIKQAGQAQTGGAMANTIGGAFGIGGLGNAAYAGVDDANRKLAETDRKISLDNQNIADQESRLSQLQATDAQEHGQDLQAAAQAQANHANEEAQRQTDFRNEVLAYLTQQKDDKHYRPVIALANVWNAKRGQYPDIVKIAQDCVDLQKIEAKAIQIAQAALKPATDLISAGKVWSAQAEIARAEDLIKSHITDALQLEFIEREMFGTKNDVKNRIEVADKKRDNVLDIAQRDAVEGSKQYDAFVNLYPDYPDQDQDRLKISDLKTQQVESKYAQKIQAIEEVIPNDPEEAKKMIEKLLGSGISDDEVSILTSKVVKLKREILDQEIDLVTKDLDEAQSYLTTVNASYAADLKGGGKPNLSFMEAVSTGTENLVRARSLQAGGIKRLEMLLNEDTDNVTKSRLVGLLETQKTALEQIDGTIATQKSDKMIVMIGVGVLAFAGIGLIIFIILFFLKRKT